MVTNIYPDRRKIQIESGDHYSIGLDCIDIYDESNKLIANVYKMPGLFITSQEENEDDD